MTTFNPKQFFASALDTGTLAHAYQFRGRDVNAMYHTGLWLAQSLNCERPTSPSQPCGQCASCHWVTSNTHPGVLTVSRLTYLALPSGMAEPDSPEGLWRKLNKLPDATQVKTEQIEQLIQQLARTAEHYRVVIFTDAETRELQESTDGTSQQNIPPPNDWASNPANEKKQLELKPLVQRLFSEASANRFLKTLEEPNPKTIFIFLTNSDDGLMETLASRCQLVPFPSNHSEAPNTSSKMAPGIIQPFLKAMLSAPDPYAATELFQKQLVTPLGLTESQALSALQLGLRYQWQRKPVDAKRFQHYQSWQQAIDLAIFRLARKANTLATLVDCFASLKGMAVRVTA